jgi:hypothetical protein
VGDAELEKQYVYFRKGPMTRIVNDSKLHTYYAQSQCLSTWIAFSAILGEFSSAALVVNYGESNSPRANKPRLSCLRSGTFPMMQYCTQKPQYEANLIDYF